MKKSFAYVDDTGIAIAIVTPASEEVFAQEVDPENPAYELPASARPEDVVNHWRWNGSGWDTVPPKPSPFHRWEDGAWRWLEKPDKDRAKRAIDAAAEQVRSQHLTPGAGQAIEYLEAYQQAKAKLANPQANAPMVSADVAAGTRNPFTAAPVKSELEAAQMIVSMHEQWQSIGSQIRAARLRHKALVDTAKTHEQLNAMVDAALSEIRGSQ